MFMQAGEEDKGAVDKNFEAMDPDNPACVDVTKVALRIYCEIWQSDKRFGRR